MSKKKRRWWVDFLVFLLVRSIVAGIQSVPMRVAEDFARLVAWFAYAVDKRHRLVAMRNLDATFGPGLPEETLKKGTLAVYEHFSRVIIEIAFLPRKLHVSNWKRYIDCDRPDRALECMLSDRGSLVVTAHFGNWEMAGFLLAAIGVRTFAIARTLDNPYLHRYLMRFREYTGQTILSKTGDFERIDRVLAERRVLISVGDQSAGVRGLFVDFFGKPASTHKAIALLALQHDARIFVGCAHRDRKDFHYRLRIGPILDPRDYEDRPDAVTAMTQDFTRIIEEEIRLAPTQYLWLHDRWKHRPVERKRRRKVAA